MPWPATTIPYRLWGRSNNVAKGSINHQPRHRTGTYDTLHMSQNTHMTWTLQCPAAGRVWPSHSQHTSVPIPASRRLKTNTCDKGEGLERIEVISIINS